MRFASELVRRGVEMSDWPQHQVEDVKFKAQS